MLNRLNHITPDLLLKPGYRIVRHALIWLSVLLITINILWDEPVRILTGRLGIWFVYFLLFLLMIYTNMYLLVPRLLLKGRTKQYILLSSLLICLFVLTVGILQSISGDDEPPVRTPPLIGITSGFAAFALFVVGLTTLQLFKYRIQNRQKIGELENATMAVELANLQNQINPHFLFNMLNNANILAEEEAERSSYILAKLNELLQYQVKKGSGKAVGLTEEIRFFEDYLELEKLRRDRFSYSIQQEGNMDITVPPLLFIPFVENAVKHNPETGSHIVILFKVTAGKLYFECANPKARFAPSGKEGGLGLVNIRRRLDLLYEGKYTLLLEDKKDLYRVKMELSI